MIEKTYFTSVVEMVRDLGNPEFAKEVEEGIARRSVSKKLVVRRNVLEKTVEDVAKELGGLSRRRTTSSSRRTRR